MSIKQRQYVNQFLLKIHSYSNTNMKQTNIGKINETELFVGGKSAKINTSAFKNSLEIYHFAPL